MDAGNSSHAERNSAASMGHQISDRLNRSYSNISSGQVRPDTWRTWSIQRAGISNTEFEAAEIDFGGSTNGRTANTSTDKIIVVTTDIQGPLDKTKDVDSSVKEINQSDVKTRLQHLEVELSSVLHSLRSNSPDLSDKMEHMSEDLRKLSDASEFQENEIMNAQEKLRSIRAKLAVLEGKMALAITDAQKVLDEKQRRIDNARRALQLLRTTCIVWPNSASEVLVAGSFDGWATQRKMEKLSTGVFSLSLKLYPGQYQIKFIVDGTWKVDPLRPIVNSGGFENNLLIVT
uniref:AMP-activated protein kinase glycogen-binding domain-containing protein n=3 Tax=Opuntia streptacantha TaxID=393608 RepID=A0A7C9AXI3_OPUST